MNQSDEALTARMLHCWNEATKGHEEVLEPLTDLQREYVKSLYRSGYLVGRIDGDADATKRAIDSIDLTFGLKPAT